MTAVNWMIEKLIERHSGEVGKEYIKIFEEAKQMEKQQIIDANYDGQRLHSKSCTKQMLQDNAEQYYNETYGSKGSDETLKEYHIVDTNEMVSIGDKIRYQKLETIAKLLAKSWFYGDWKWENPNERVQQMLMQELGYYPFKDEDEMIHHTQVDDNLYKQAANEIKGWSELPKDISISSQTEISDEEINEEAKRLYDDSDKEYYAFFMGAMFYREQLKKKQ